MQSPWAAGAGVTPWRFDQGQQRSTYHSPASAPGGGRWWLGQGCWQARVGANLEKPRREGVIGSCLGPLGSGSWGTCPWRAPTSLWGAPPPDGGSVLLYSPQHRNSHSRTCGHFPPGGGWAAAAGRAEEPAAALWLPIRAQEYLSEKTTSRLSGCGQTLAGRRVPWALAVPPQVPGSPGPWRTDSSSASMPLEALAGNLLRE